MNEDSLVEKWRAYRANKFDPVVKKTFYNPDGTINPLRVYVALGLVFAAVGGAVYFNKDEIKESLAKFFEKNGTNISKESYVSENVSNLTTTTVMDNNATIADPYDSIKNDLKDIPFLRKNGTLTVKNLYNRSIKDYLTSLLNDPSFVNEIQNYMTSEPHKRIEDHMNLSFSKFGEINFYELDQIGNVSFYTPPHYNITKMNLTKYGFSKDESLGIQVFHLKPGILNSTSFSEPEGGVSPIENAYASILNLTKKVRILETEQKLVSPEEAYAEIRNLTNNSQKLKTFGTDPSKRDFAVAVSKKITVTSTSYQPNEELIILSNGTLSGERLEAIRGKFQTKSSSSGGIGASSGGGNSGDRKGGRVV